MRGHLPAAPWILSTSGVYVNTPSSRLYLHTSRVCHLIHISPYRSQIEDMASIRTYSTYDRHGYTYYPVAIIGAGESGIAMGCQLKQQLNFDQFRIFERRSGIGGTWWSNRYPGVACDMYALCKRITYCKRQTLLTFPQPGCFIFLLLRTEPKMDFNLSLRERDCRVSGRRL